MRSPCSKPLGAIPAFAAAPAVTRYLAAVYLAQLVAEVIHRVRVLREHDHRIPPFQNVV